MLDIVIRGAKNKFSKKGRILVFIATRGRCFYCSKQLTRQSFTIDHVIPLMHGGEQWLLTNLVACCEPCNTKKGDTYPDEETINRAAKLYDYLRLPDKTN